MREEGRGVIANKQWVRAFFVSALLVGCGHHDPQQEASVDVQAVFSVPSSNVNCIQIVATGAKRAATQTFAVAGGQSTATLFMGGISAGNVLFTGSGFNEQCGMIVAASVPTWLGDNVNATVSIGGPPTTVSMPFRPNGRALVGGNFVDDQYTSSTLAGVAGTAGATDGTGSAARLEGPNGNAFDGGDTLYFADRNITTAGANVGMTIRKVSVSTGLVTTLGGSATAVGTADNAIGTSATFVRLFGVALSADNSTLYILDRCALRKMSTAAPNAVSTVLGARTADSTNWVCGGGNPGVLLDLAVRATSIYLVDGGNSVISKIPLTGAPTVTVVAGISGNAGFNDGTLTTARFSPVGIVFPFSTDDVFFVLDNGNTAPDGFSGGFWGTVRRVAPVSNSVFTVAGAPQTGNLIRDGVGANALFVQPRRAVSDGSSLFIGDSTAVRRMDLSAFPATVVTIAGGNTAGSTDGVGTAALVNAPFGVSRNAASGALYLSDQGNFTIRVLTP